MYVYLSVTNKQGGRKDAQGARQGKTLCTGGNAHSLRSNNGQYQYKKAIACPTLLSELWPATSLQKNPTITTLAKMPIACKMPTCKCIKNSPSRVSIWLPCLACCYAYERPS